MREPVPVLHGPSSSSSRGSSGSVGPAVGGVVHGSRSAPPGPEDGAAGGVEGGFKASRRAHCRPPRQAAACWTSDGQATTPVGHRQEWAPRRTPPRGRLPHACPRRNDTRAVSLSAFVVARGHGGVVRGIGPELGRAHHPQRRGSGLEAHTDLAADRPDARFAIWICTSNTRKSANGERDHTQRATLRRRPTRIAPHVRTAPPT